MKRYWPLFLLFCSTILGCSLIVIGLLVLDQRTQDAADARANESIWIAYDSAIAACKRGHDIRFVLHEFLDAAADARRFPPLEPGDLAAAVEYERLDSKVWPLIPCEDLIAQPVVARPDVVSLLPPAPSGG